MNITIELSQNELEEIELDKTDLHSYIVDTIDDKGDICFPPYNVIVIVVSQ